MDDGGRCLLDVIDDPQLLQSWMESSNQAMDAHRMDAHLSSSLSTTLSTSLSSGLSQSGCQSEQSRHGVHAMAHNIVNMNNMTHNMVNIHNIHNIQSIQMMQNPTKVSDVSAAKQSSAQTIASDTKQVDHVTSSGASVSPKTLTSAPVGAVKQLQPQQSPQIMIDEKQTLNMVSSSVNLIPLSALSTSAATTSIALANQSLPTLSNSTTLPLRSPPTSSWPTSIQLAAPRGGGALTVQLPQQLLVPAGAMQMTSTGGLSQLVLTSGRGSAPLSTLPSIPTISPITSLAHTGQQSLQLPPGIQPGQLVQIIQTPTGTQILPTSQPPTVQQIVTTCGATKSSSTSSSSRSNKQILPKPPGSNVSTSSSVPTNGVNKCGQLQQTSALKVINSLQSQSNGSQFVNTSIATNATTGATQQILIGSNGQPTGVIQAPHGTLLFNQIIPGLGSQPILIQGNVPTSVQSLQLTLRPQSHTTQSVMTVNSGLSGANIGSQDNSALLNALAAGQQSNSAKAHTPSQSPQPQTIVIPNHSTAVSSAPQMIIPTSSMVMTTGGRAAPNFIITRPPLMATQTQPTMTSGQQLFHIIQTPNGPVLVALQSHPQLQTTQFGATQQSNQSGQNQANSIQTHNIQLANAMIPIGTTPTLQSTLTQNLQTNAHPALHALLNQHTDVTANGQTVLQSVPNSNTVIFAPQTQIITGQRPQIQTPTSASFVVSSQQQSKNSAPSVNLAELLKEHGILPESSPPSSPTNNCMTDLSSNGVQSEMMHQNHTTSTQPTVLMVGTGPNQPPNIVLTQTPVTPTTPQQLRLALGPDCSVILHPHITANNVQQQIQSQCVSNSRTYSDSLKDNGLGSSQPSPDSTTPSIDSTSTTSANCNVSQQVTTTTTTTTLTAPTIQGQNSSALLEQLNTAPAVKVPDLVASMALQQGSAINTTDESKGVPKQTTLIPLTVQNINNSIDQQQKQTILTIPVQSGESGVCNAPANAVIRFGNCDTLPTSLVLTTTPTTVFASPNRTIGQTGTIPVLSPSNCTNNAKNSNTNGAATVIDQNGVPMIQVSPNNQEFLQRLETQLKSLLALKSPTNQQKELLQELIGLQQKMIQARVQSHLCSEEPKVVLTAASQMQLSPQSQLSQSQTVAQTLPQTIAPTLSQSLPQTTSNVHLVNLLKSGPVTQTSSPQIRLLTPANTVPVSSTTTIQVGNQLITFTTPAKQQLQNLKSLATNQPQIPTATPVILRLHAPTPTTSSSLVTSSLTTKTVNKIDSHSEQERRNIKILKAIQQQLSVDQAAAVKPDTKRPFKSRDDACKRLLRYHVFNSPTMSFDELEKSDELFESVSQHLLHKKQQLIDKFRILLLKQSMKETPSSEHVMLDRMFISEETASLKNDKELVAEGKVLELPPPPDSWYQLLRSSIEEEQKLFINRKRKSSIGSDEYHPQSSQIRRQDYDSEDSEDEDEDSDDEDDNNGEKDDVSGYLASASDANLSDVGNYFDSFQHNHNHVNQVTPRMESHVPLNNYVDPTTANDLEIYSDINEDNSQDWTNSILANTSNNRRISWNSRFGVPESEAAVAVESILNAEDEEEGDISVDLSAIDGLDDNLEEDEEDDDVDDGDDGEDDDEDEEDLEDENDYLSNEPHQQHVDLQMQCAIKSIMPVQQSHLSANSYYHSHNQHHHNHHLNDYRNLEYPHIPNIHDHRRADAMMRGYNGGIAPAINDPNLDEAVKSILS